MQHWRPEDVARAAGARVLEGERVASGPSSAVIDSRQAGPGTLFFGLRGASQDGGRFAASALAAGAWGVIASESHARAAVAEARSRGRVVFVAEDPLRALQNLATAWRRELGARVIGVTGSTGKTSTKDLLLAVLAPHRRTVASRANFNTEIGLPLEILGAPAGTEVLVLEMAMRGAGQIAELAAVAEPDVGVIVTIGPVHLELLGSIEAIAATKAELIAALPPGRGTAVIPAGEALLAPHLRSDITTVTFGVGGDASLLDADGEHVTIDLRGRLIELQVPFTQAHLRTNLLAAVAAADAIGVTPGGRVEATLSPGRGQRVELPGGVTLIDDCYNANPMSMKAALDDLAATAAGDQRRRVAVLGDMLELGPDERSYHVVIGEHAARTDVDVLVTVGPLASAMADGFDGEVHATRDAGEAAALLPDLVEPGDVVLVKASRGVGLELVCGALGSEAFA
ncbi:MAG: UDP-N-acetylmuramoyl-tripeptide--D-alanyl-D-alanine ligase [Solirubrobacteraceae bacterium]